MLDLELSPAAEIDFDDAVDWYYAHDEDVKVDFIEAVNSTLAFIKSSPSSFPVIYGSSVRKALVKKFPFRYFIYRRRRPNLRLFGISY